jgi:acetoin utilization protein AcuB
MLVGERMSHPVFTVHPETPIQDALNLMRKEHIRRAPVVDKRGRMIGIVSEMDLLNASPSDATSLSVWELNYLVSKITVEQVMSKEVITVGEDTPIEEAARIMIDNQIGGLPVMREGELVGMITETDLFKLFLELFGARERGVRVTALVPEEPGQLAELTKAVYSIGGNIVALGTFLGESTENRLIALKVDGVEAKSLQEAIEPLVERVVDIRQT